MDDYNAIESAKKHIRVIMLNEKGKNTIGYERNDKYETMIDNEAQEDLLLREDIAKINLYQTSKYITLYNGKTYEVIRREFMPCIPVTLTLYLKEV